MGQNSVSKTLFVTVALLYSLSSDDGLASQITVSTDEAFTAALDYLDQHRHAEADLIIKSLKETSIGPLMLLEIGRIEFSSEKYETARATFNQVLKSYDLPETTTIRIKNYLREIKKRLGEWSYSPSIIQTKNPNKKARSGTYIVLGMPLSYTNVENKKYWGIRHSISFLKAYANNWSLDSHFYFEDVEGNIADNQVLRVFLSDEKKPKSDFLVFSAEFEDGVGFEQKTLGGKLGSNMQFSKIHYEPALSFYKIYHSQDNVLSGKKFELGQNIQISRRNVEYFVNGSAGTLSLKEKSFSKDYMDISLGADFYYKDLVLTPTIYRGLGKHKATDFLWGLRKTEDNSGLSVALCKERMASEGSKFCLKYSYNNVGSNIRFYKYKNHLLELSF